MPKFTIPMPEKMEGEDLGNSLDYPGARSVFLPANQEILDSLELGQEVEVQLIGRVKSLEQREREGEADDFLEFSVELREVDAYAPNEFEKLSEEDDD